MFGGVFVWRRDVSLSCLSLFNLVSWLSGKIFRGVFRLTAAIKAVAGCGVLFEFGSGHVHAVVVLVTPCHTGTEFLGQFLARLVEAMFDLWGLGNLGLGQGRSRSCVGGSRDIRELRRGFHGRVRNLDPGLLGNVLPGLLRVTGCGSGRHHIS